MNLHYKSKIKYLATLFIILITTLLSGCIDLSSTKILAAKKAPIEASHYGKAAAKKTKVLMNGEVHTMRGGLGIFSIGMNVLSTKVATQYNIPASATMWYNAGNVSRSIINYHHSHKSRPVILIGHSLGANEQIKVARNLDKAGVPVDLLITIDAVSQTIIPPNVRHALNFYKPGFVPMFSGLKLRAVNPNSTFIENINVNSLKGVKVNHFTIDKNEAVQTMILAQIKKVLTNANKKQV